MKRTSPFVRALGATPIIMAALLALGCKSSDGSASEGAASPSAEGPKAAPTGGSDLGRAGDPVDLVVGYQPYYTQSWSGVVMRGKKFYEKYLPPGSKVEFQVGLQGAIIVNNMLAGKQHLGYLGDMPAIVATTKAEVADLRIVATIGLALDQCNVILTRNDAPQFASATEALQWLHGKQVAAPKGSCTDRFARAVFAEQKVEPSDYLNQNIEVITSNFRAKKIDAAVIWEPTASRLVTEGLARRVASGVNLNETDGGFLVFRAELIEQRQDIVTAWLNAELDAQLFLADENNADEVVDLALSQTTGFGKRALWYSLYGTFPDQGERTVRLELPFGITPTVRQHLDSATAFLHSIKTIHAGELRKDAVAAQFAEQVLRERHLTAPIGAVDALPDQRAPQN